MMVRLVTQTLLGLTYLASKNVFGNEIERFKVIDPAFQNIPLQEGVQIWRIMSFRAVPVPKEDYGLFHRGDSYIVLCSKLDEVNRNGYKHDIYLWKGKETSQDEAGAAAFLMVNLDYSLKGMAKQHQLSEGEEPEELKRCIQAISPKGMKVVEDGVDSAFRHVTPNSHHTTTSTNPAEELLKHATSQLKHVDNHHSTALYSIALVEEKVAVREVEAKVAAMNKEHCNILDSDPAMYLYCGEKTQPREKLLAAEFFHQLPAQNSKARIDISMNPDKETQDTVFKLLGSGSDIEVPETTENRKHTSTGNEQASFYTVNNDQKTEKFNSAKKSNLLSERCVVLDTPTHAFVWIGKRATKEKRGQALALVEVILKTDQRKSSNKAMVYEGEELLGFIQWFTSW